MKLVLFLVAILAFCNCQYNETESIQLAAYSLSTYCKLDNLNPFDCGKICQRSGSLSNVQFIEDDDDNLFGFFGYQEEKDQILVAFRGSILTNAANIKIDVDILKMDYEFCDDCQVANGFYSSYMKLKTQTNKLFEEYRKVYPNSKIVATGHSLGAALATFFASDIYQQYQYSIDSLYTFGSPRLGNEEFVSYYNSIVQPSIHFRVVKARDNIARYPFKELGYRHVGQEIYYDEQDNFILCQSEFDPLCDKYYFWDWSFEDHQKYVKCTFAQFRGDQKCSGHKSSSQSQHFVVKSQLRNNY